MVYDDGIFFCPTGYYCLWAADLYAAGYRPDSDWLGTIYDLMLAGF
jgi:hypothetical protein